MPKHDDGKARRDFLNNTAEMFRRAGGIPDDAIEEAPIFLQASMVEVAPTIRRRCNGHNQIEVDDVLSETLVDLSRGGFPSSILRIEGPFVPWLHKTAINNFKDAIRRRRARRGALSVEIKDDHICTDAGPTHPIDGDILIVELFQSLQTDTDKILYQYLIGILDFDETTDLLQSLGTPCSPATIFRKLASLRKKLREKVTLRA